VTLVITCLLGVAVTTWILKAALEEPGGDRAPAVGATPDAPSSRQSSGSAVLEVSAGATRVAPMTAVPLSGHVDGVPSGTRLHVQLRDPGGHWVSFPLRPVVDDSGRFSTYVELGERGVHEIRVLELESGLTSGTVVIRVR
jgi:hypothetical protein